MEIISIENGGKIFNIEVPEELLENDKYELAWYLVSLSPNTLEEYQKVLHDSYKLKYINKFKLSYHNNPKAGNFSLW